mmetsp:Transcript_23554/g.54973  ORF Transcript_23554/g.54973 Transcript_23554/m.54973 type:complete len:82 (-) Transcript_23554:1555-1800(-)
MRRVMAKAKQAAAQAPTVAITAGMTLTALCFRRRRGLGCDVLDTVDRLDSDDSLDTEEEEEEEESEMGGVEECVLDSGEWP